VNNDLKKRFEKLYSGLIYDAMTFDLKISECFVLDKTIRLQFPYNKVVFGQAFTCKGKKVLSEKEIDDTVRIKMFKDFFDGCIQLIDTDRDETVAHFGDISGRIARKFGASAAIVDGYTRDIALLRNDKFPIFCKGVMPVDAYGKWQIVDYQTEINMLGNWGDVTVRPFDYIFGDEDSVIIIKKEIVSEVCECAEERLRKENIVREEIFNTNDIQEVYDRIGRW